MSDIKCPVCGKPLKKYVYQNHVNDRKDLPLNYDGSTGFRCGDYPSVHEQPWELVILRDGSEWGYVLGHWQPFKFTSPPAPRKGKLIGNRLFQQ